MAVKDEVGLSNSKLSQGRRRMLDLVNKLHSTGVQVDIDLPQIAVIGSQSAGKSSLIEAISGITLPRAAGTCTRCPTECRLSRTDAPWQCIVSLRFITDADGEPLGQARNERFGAIIYDRCEVEERIRSAQLAILNPKVPSKNFLNIGSEFHPNKPSKGQLSFSSNAVTLQISGPDVADLSFCDLPGLIASVSNHGGNSADIALVQALVATYIKKPSCIILLTVACETDFENQGAHSLAKRYDPEGKRTIGVLTKPDRIPEGEEGNWFPFIKNEKEVLENNWYCVKQPSSSDLKENPTWADARRMENDFFSSTAPWCDLDSIYQKFLRTGNLVDRLSSILSDLISKRLPQIQDELEKSMDTTRASLAQFPPAPSNNPRTEILALLYKFTSDLTRHVQGVSGLESEHQMGLIQAIRFPQERFRFAIRATAPKFVPFEKTSKNGRLPAASFLRAEDGGNTEEDVVMEDEEPPSEEETESEGESGSEDGSSSPAPVQRSKVVSAPTACKKRKEHPDDLIYVDDVMETAGIARTRELPGNFPFSVQQTFIDKIIDDWHTPAQDLCKATYSIVLDHINSLAASHFHEFGQGHLEHRIKNIIQQHMKERLQYTEETVKWIFDLEAVPFTLNTHYLADYKDKFLAHYKGARYACNHSNLASAVRDYEAKSMVEAPRKKGVPSSAPTEPRGIAKILVGLAEIGVTNVTPEHLASLLPTDPMDPALVIMSDVRAYFQVAYKRFADNIPLAIDKELVRGATDNLLTLLCTKLGINSEDGAQICKELSEESPRVSGRRAELEKKLERLEIASGELLAIVL